MALENMSDLLEEQLKDLYSAENQLSKALKKMAKKATTKSLKNAFQSHLEETEDQIAKLKQVCEDLDIKPTGKTCAAMKGLCEEGAEVIEEEGDDIVIDAALIAAAQRAEHYEISAYGTAIALANALGHKNVVKTLRSIQEQESATDKKLTAISERELLSKA